MPAGRARARPTTLAGDRTRARHGLPSPRRRPVKSNRPHQHARPSAQPPRAAARGLGPVDRSVHQPARHVRPAVHHAVSARARVLGTAGRSRRRRVRRRRDRRAGPGGLLADRIGRRNTIALSMFGGAVADALALWVTVSARSSSSSRRSASWRSSTGRRFSALIADLVRPSDGSPPSAPTG